jgi:hypothetical protein
MALLRAVASRLGFMRPEEPIFTRQMKLRWSLGAFQSSVILIGI